MKIPPFQPINIFEGLTGKACPCPDDYCQPVRWGDPITVQFWREGVEYMRGEVIDREGNKWADIPPEWFEVRDDVFRLSVRLSDFPELPDLLCPFRLRFFEVRKVELQNCEFNDQELAHWEQTGEGNDWAWSGIGNFAYFDGVPVKHLRQGVELCSDFELSYDIENLNCGTFKIIIEGDNERTVVEHTDDDGSGAEHEGTVPVPFQEGDNGIRIEFEGIDEAPCDGSDKTVYVNKVCINAECETALPDSNCFEITDDKGCELLLTAGNASNAFGFDFSEHWLFAMRLPVTLRRVQYVENREHFRNSKGVHSLQYDRFNKRYEMMVASVPEWVHDALRMMVGCTDLKINGVQIMKESGEYAPEWSNVLSEWQGRMNVVEDTRMRNQRCADQPIERISGAELPEVQGVDQLLAAICNAYIARVESDSGQVNDEQDTCNFISALSKRNVYDHAHRVHFAGGGMKLDGDKIEKLYDIKNGVDPTFAGDDRPEKHLTLQGAHQVSVEKGVTNLAEWSRSFENDWWLKIDCDVIDNNLTAPDVTNTARKIKNDGVVAGRIRTSIMQISDDEKEYTASLYVRRLPGFLFLLLQFRGGTSIDSGIQVNKETGEFIDTPFLGANFIPSLNLGTIIYENWIYVYITQKNNNSGNNQMRVELQPDRGNSLGNAAQTDGSAIVWQLDCINSKYPTLFILTEGSAVTRPAPNPVIPNFLPLQGGVGGWVDMVRDNDAPSQHIWSAGNAGVTNRSRFSLQGSANNFFVNIFGTLTGGQLGPISNPFTWSNFERFVFGHIVFYDTSTIRLYLCDTQGNIYYYEASHVYNDTSFRDIHLGVESTSGNNPTSIRYSNLSPLTQVWQSHARSIEILSAMSMVEGGAQLEPADFTPQNFLI